jgi:hypothetical protein
MLVRRDELHVWLCLAGPQVEDIWLQDAEEKVNVPFPASGFPN